MQLPHGGCRLGAKGCHPGPDSEGAASNAGVRGTNPVLTPPPPGDGARGGCRRWGSHTYSSMLMGQESGMAAAWQERPEGTW